MKYIVRSFVSIEIEVEADDKDEAVDLAGDEINTVLNGCDYDFFSDAIVYDEDGEEVEDQQ